MALLDFSYNPIGPPNSRETDWDEGQWLELASMPRFWPGFIQGFLSDPNPQGQSNASGSWRAYPGQDGGDS